MLYYIKKTWKNSFLTILCQVISYSIEVFAALASMKMLDGLLAQDTQLFLFGLVAHLGVWAISFLASHMETVFHYRAQRQINELERKDMVEMLLKKSYSEYHAEESGSYLSGFTNDIAQMEQLGWEPLFGMFGVLAQIVSSLIALFYLHWSLLAVSIIFGILMVLLPRIFNQKLENAGNICSRLQAEAVSQFKELLAGYDVLRSFGKKDRMVCGTETANEQMETPRYHLKVLKSAIGNGMGFLSVVFQVSVRLLAGILILTGILNLSVMVSVSTICSNVYNGLKQLVNLQLSLTSGKPYFEKLSNHRDTVSHDNKKSLPAFSRSISVENLSFNYGKKTVLNHASFSFEKGKKYALTGPSGCGKSTLLKILLGWLPDYTGCVCFDDIDIQVLRPAQHLILCGERKYMEPNKEANKLRISYRYYELPEGELVQAITGEDWVCTYGTYAEDVHFHNVMEIGICRWGQGLMVLEDRHIDYTDGAVTVVPANCLHTTLSRDKSLNSWEYLFFDPAGILNSAFPNDPLFVESVLHRLSSEALCLPQEDAVELERLITMVLNECQTKHEYHKAVEQNLMTSLLLLITRSYTEKKTHIRPMTVGLQQIMPAIEYIGMHYMNPISGEDLASICSLSEAQLRRKFKEYLNMSPVEYLTMVRIQKAYELLNSTNYPMTEVALRVGYQDVSSFNRNFQKIMGVSPYQYKKNNSDYRGRVLDKKISAKKGWKHPSDP